MLLVKASPETGLFRHLCNHVFRRLKFQNTSGRRIIFFEKIFKTELKVRKWKKKLPIIFCFWDNSIWKCCYKLSLIRTEYLLLALNKLTKSPKILHITHRNYYISQLYSQWPINVVKVQSFSFEKCFGQFAVYFFKGRLKRDFLGN